MTSERIHFLAIIILIVTAILCFFDKKNRVAWGVAFVGIAMTYLAALGLNINRTTVVLPPNDVQSEVPYNRNIKIDQIEEERKPIDKIATKTSHDQNDPNISPEKVGENYQVPEEIGTFKPIDRSVEEKNCMTSNTGDYCFINSTTTKLSISIAEHSEPMITPYNSKNLVIDMNEKSCLYDLKEGVYKYQITYNFENNDPHLVAYLVSPSVKTGEIKVEKCLSKEITLNFKR